MFEEQIRSFEEQIKPLRTAQVSPELVLPMKVTVNNHTTFLRHVANVLQQGPQLNVLVWDKKNVPAVAAAFGANGYSASVQGDLVLVHVPPPTKEQTDRTLRTLAALLEDAKVAVRNERKKLRERAAREHSTKDAVARVHKNIELATVAAVTKLESIHRHKVATISGEG